MKRADVQEAARAWLGVPYRHGGRSHAGLDCIGLLVMVGLEFGVAHVDQKHYGAAPDPLRLILAELDRVLELRPPSEPWEGTIGVFAQERLPCHVGIFSRKHYALHLIHALIVRKRVVEEPYSHGPHNQDFRLIRRYGFPGLEG